VRSSTGRSPDEIARTVLARAEGPGRLLEDGEDAGPAERLMDLHEDLDGLRLNDPAFGSWMPRAVLRAVGAFSALFVAIGIVAATVSGASGVPFLVVGGVFGYSWFRLGASLERREEAARLLEEEIDRIHEER
jgi:hypothetical protein